MSTKEGVTKIRVGFLISGHGLEPEEVTARLGLQPTATWRRGQPRMAVSARTHDSDGWVIRTDYEDSLDLLSHVRRILDLVHPRAEAVRQICESGEVSSELECVVRITGNEVQTPPIVFFDGDTIRQLADLKADLDIDINLISL